MNRDQERQKRNERFQRRRNLQSSSQPTSRDPSPSQASSELHQLPVVTGGSNPDVREAVRVMEAEVDMFSQIMERVNALIAEVQGCKEQNDRLENRLQRQEEMLREQRQPEDRAERDDQQQALVVQREEEIQQLRRQLHQQRTELEEARHSQSVRDAAPTDAAPLQVTERDEIRQLRRRLQELEGELASSRLSHVSPRTSQVGDTIRPPPVPPQPRPRSRPQTPEPVDRPLPPQSQSQQTTLPYPPYRSLPERIPYPSQPRDLSTRCYNCSPANGFHASCSSNPPVSYVFTKEKVPHFKGDVSASQPLKRNQEIEGWIRAVENIVKPPTSEAYIQAARANCRGPAELIINSPLFDNINEWEAFKAALRSKFRGTYTSSDFFKVLYENRMLPGQAPMDYYLQLEGSVYQGYRDHRDAIGDPAELVRRVFLSGIPAWLRDFLAVREDGNPTQLAETAQRIWNSRNGIHHGDHSSMSSGQFPERPPRGRDHYALPVSAEAPAMHSIFPVTAQGKWCSYHRVPTHNTSECRAVASSAPNSPPRRLCFQCRRPGHLAKECPFQQSQGEGAPTAPGRVGAGSMQSTSHTSQEVDRHNDNSRANRTTTRGTQY
ncbi:hypothetical protein C7M84_016697 [Penaeus vannamei]|uniref:CCHC-type domain-containing protein n=1 Tax=Penaeus vannamei TaxID=6689 RepID=A0A3R7LWW9_PENVA|nr:hypothetical protein C7M84_016697 [Penaeus vannamei]